jgi:hypothetical protein
MLITNVDGVRVDDWPETEEGFPLRIRYSRENSHTAETLQLLENEEIYAAQGLDMAAMQAKACHFLRTFGLKSKDVGVRNVDERGNYIYNQCFYLSLARGLLGHNATQKQIREVALKLKRNIEAAVIAERPHWKKEVGEEAQAFADFLPLAMRAKSCNSLLSELAVCVVDSSTSQVDVYLGPMYKEIRDVRMQQRNLVVLWHVPGHYQCVVNDDRQNSKVMMSYRDFRNLLLSQNVPFTETLE